MQILKALSVFLVGFWLSTIVEAGYLWVFQIEPAAWLVSLLGSIP